MAFTPISNDFIQYQAQASGTSAAGYFLKLYAAGTTTPISTALDSAGSTLVAKVELDSLGFAKNGSGGATTLYIDQIYRLVLFVNATDADANTFGNAVQDIDNIPTLVTGSGQAVNLLSRATLNAAVIDTSLQAGLAIDIAERTTGNDGGGIWDVVESSTVTPNTYNIVICTGVGALALVLREDQNVVYATQWGLIADGAADYLSGTDNQPVWQAIIDAAPNNGLKLFLPNGRINVLTPVEYGVGTSVIRRISTEGVNGTDGTVVFTTATITTLVKLPQIIADANNVSGGEFISIDFRASSKADFGMQGLGNHMLFRDCRFRFGLLAGSDISQGWDNMFDHCYWLNNVGDGARMDQGQGNQDTYNGCKFVANNGFGAVIKGGFVPKFNNVLFEENKKGGAFCSGMNGLNFDTCYFEKNGEDGNQFTTPSKLVKADIILNGSSDQTTMSVGAPCFATTIQSSFTSTAHVECHVYAISAPGLQVLNPTLNIGSPVVPVVKAFGSTTTSSQFFRCSDMRIDPGQGDFTTRLVIENSTTAFAGQPGIIFLGLEDLNIGEDDLNAWVQNVAGVGGAWQRSTEVHESGLNTPVWEMFFNSTSTSDRQGFSIDSADYPQLHGKPCIFTVDVKAAATNTPTITLNANGGTRTTTSTDWFPLSLIFNMPVSGSINLDVSKTGGLGTAFFANPVFAELGSNTETMGRRIPVVSATFRSAVGGALPPTTGTWNRGDKIIDITPTAGSFSEQICVTSGTPGTWKTANPITS